MIKNLITVLIIRSILTAERCSLFSDYNKKVSLNEEVNPPKHRVLNLIGLKKFSDLDPKCLFPISKKLVLLPDEIDIIPYSPICLEKGLMVNLPHFLNNKRPGIIRLNKIKAFDINNDLFRNFDNFEFISLEFYESDLNVVSNGSNSCKKNEIFFKNLSYISFSLSIKYKTKTCPLLFSYLNIKVLAIQGLSNTFLKKNILDFMEIQNSSKLYNINSLILKSYKSSLTKRLIDQNIFNNTYCIISGLINFIESDTFSDINLNGIEILNENFLSLFQDGGIWLNAFDYFIEIKISFWENYDFSNTDICFFKYVPKNKTTFISVPLYSLEPVCTCSMLIVFSSYFNLKIPKKYFSLWDTYEKLESIGCLNEKFLNTCNLNKNLEQCDNELKTYSSDKNKLLHYSLYIDFIGIIVSQIISFLGICFNAFSIFILLSEKNIKVKKLDSSYSMNKLMLINSLINLAYFIINFLHIINRCVQINGIFCSSIYQSSLAQYYEIYMVEFLGSILKMWSGLSLISISIKRLGLLSSKNWFRNKRLNLKILIILIIISILINLDKIFTIVLNRDIYLLDEEFSNEFPSRNTFLLSLKEPRYLG
ncbi:unnamed protein product, partial [Brachionus calyciflorus]